MKFDSFYEYAESNYCSDAVNALLDFFAVDPDDGYGSFPNEENWKANFRIYMSEDLLHVEIPRSYLYHCCAAESSEEARSIMMEMVCVNSSMNVFKICPSLEAAQMKGFPDKAVLIDGFVIFNVS